MVKDWRDVSVLVVGCGSIGRRHVRVLRSLGVRDLRACDPLPAQQSALLAESPQVHMYDALEAGLRDKPDTVFICTPPWLHIPQALQAVQAGSHVFCEKPLSDSLDGIDDLAAAAARQDRLVMVGLCFRYHQGLLKAKQYLDVGRVGRVVCIRAMVGEHLPEVRADYLTLYYTQRNGAFELMHEIDLALWYADRPVRRVMAISGTYAGMGFRAPEVAEILIDFEDQRMASVHLDFFQRPRRRQTELICTGGLIIIEFARWDRSTVSVYEAETKRWMHEEMATERDDMFRAEDGEFLQAVAEGRPIRYGIAEARRSVEVVVAAQKTP